MRSEKIWKEQIETSRWIDEKEVSRITGIAIQTLRNWRCQGIGFPYSKGPGGRIVRYLLDDVVRVMSEGKINPRE